MKREIKVQVCVLDTTTGDKYVIHVQYSTENCEFKSKVRPILHDSTPWFAFTENINVLYTKDYIQSERQLINNT